jgi:sucrose-6F-phosphate phosphohydrolase
VFFLYNPESRDNLVAPKTVIGRDRGESEMPGAFLLASDLDGTIIPVESHPEYRREVARFSRAIREDRAGRLAYVTGRHLSLALHGVDEHALPRPDWLVCDAGTSVYAFDRGAFVLDEEYRGIMRRRLGGMTAAEFAGPLLGFSPLVPQEPEKQAEFKQSYYVEHDVDLNDVLSLLHGRLDRAGLDCNLVLSVDPETERGLLDLLPTGVNKGSALAYLQAKTRIRPDRIAFAGDSGHDLAALVGGFQGIVVGNAEASLKGEVRRQAARLGRLDRVYFAESDLVSGVLEGCRHFELLPPEARSDPGRAE